MIRSLKFSGWMFFSSKSFWISWRIVNVVNPWKLSTRIQLLLCGVQLRHGTRNTSWDLQLVLSVLILSTQNWICVDPNFYLLPFNRLIIEQCWSCPWWWWIIQASHIQNFFRMFLYNFLCCSTQSECFWVLCSCRFPTPWRNLDQSEWRLSSTMPWTFIVSKHLFRNIPLRT